MGEGCEAAVNMEKKWLQFQLQLQLVVRIRFFFKKIKFDILKKKSVFGYTFDVDLVIRVSKHDVG